MNKPSGPPANVPTLTDIVDQVPDSTSTPCMAGPPDETPAAVQAQAVQQVLARIDELLEKRLREAAEQFVMERAEFLLPRLRLEIKALVHDAVDQAFAKHFLAGPAPSEVSKSGSS